MPAKKALKTRKPTAKKAASRRTPAARKVVRVAKPTAHKAKAAGSRATAGKSVKAKSGKSPRISHLTRPAAKPIVRVLAPLPVKPMKAAKVAAPMRAPAVAKPHSPMPPPQFAEPRPPLATAQARLARRPGPLDEEDESPGGHNLLMGPRNVRPYHERKGDQYMGKEHLAHFRVILNSWKRDLMEEVDRTMTHMKDEAANPPDPNDRATLESEFALELRTRDRERKLIRKIDEALSRIDDGTYGYCIETGEPIGVKRLEARPVATLCIEAQERRERREKQYGDRDDWYR
jgi:DnaK suppressor protein